MDSSFNSSRSTKTWRNIRETLRWWNSEKIKGLRNMSAAATLPPMSHPGTLPLIRIFTASLLFLRVYHERGGEGMTKCWGLPEDRRRWWRGHMPLKQEQASPERPRCMGGANEHWGFRNPSRRQTEQRENINGLKATLKDNKTDKAKGFSNNASKFCEETKQYSKCIPSCIHSVCTPVRATVILLISTSQYASGEGGEKKKKKKGEKKSRARAGWAALFRPGARFSWGRARSSYCLPLGSREVILQ